MKKTLGESGFIFDSGLIMVTILLLKYTVLTFAFPIMLISGMKVPAVCNDPSKSVYFLMIEG